MTKKHFLNKKIKLAVLTLATLLVCLPSIATAAPDPLNNPGWMGSSLTSGSPAGNNSYRSSDHVHFLRKSVSKGDMIVKLSSYYTFSSGGLYFQINPRACDLFSTAGADTSYITVTVNAGGASADYFIRRGDLSNNPNACAGDGTHTNVTGSAAAGSPAHSNVLYARYPLPAAPGLDPETGNTYYRADITIRYTTADAETPGARLTVTGNGSPLLSQQKQNYQPGVSIDRQTTYPIIGTNSANTQNSAIAMPFGVACNAANNTPGFNGLTGQYVTVFDADNGGPNFVGSTVYARVYDVTAGTYINVTATTGGQNLNKNGNSSPTWFRPNNDEKNESAFRIDMVRHHKYEMQLMGIAAPSASGVNNTVTFGLPQASIFGVINCPPPTANPVAGFAVGATFAPNTSVTGVASVQNTQGDSSSSSWSHYIWMDANGNSRYDAGETAVTPTPFPTGSTTYAGVATTSIPNVSGTIPATAHNGARICTAVDLDENTFKNVTTGATGPASVTTNTYTFSDGTTNKGYAVSCTTVFIPGARPYFSVKGGDIAAGLDFVDTSGSCVPKNSDITGSNIDTAPYKGTGTELAALALGNINAFATAKTLTSLGAWRDTLTGGAPAANSGASLAFSRTTVPPGQLALTATNGGCVSNYYEDAKDTAATDPAPSGTLTTIQLLSLADGKYYHNGPLTLNGGTILADGRKIVLVVNGDVHISGNISYLTPLGVAGIPQFQVISNGNITVENTVDRIDGFYDAQGGKFTTCTDSTGAKLSGTPAINACKINPLVVNGVIAAKTLIPNRTYGDRSGLYGQPAQPGEIFRFSPQFWLPYTRSNGGVGPWDSVTSLPPIL